MNPIEWPAWRLEALRLAVSTGPDGVSSELIVERAEAFYQFLVRVPTNYESQLQVMDQTHQRFP